MKLPAELKHFALAFLIALVLYAVAFTFIEGRRHQDGPWEVNFVSATNLPATLFITQTNLHIDRATIIFHGTASATNETIRFNQAREMPFATPFGECVFQDILFQPGTVVLKIFGHEIQLMPKTLTIDKREMPWTTNLSVTLDQ